MCSYYVIYVYIFQRIQIVNSIEQVKIRNWSICVICSLPPTPSHKPTNLFQYIVHYNNYSNMDKGNHYGTIITMVLCARKSDLLYLSYTVGQKSVCIYNMFFWVDRSAFFICVDVIVICSSRGNGGCGERPSKPFIRDNAKVLVFGDSFNGNNGIYLYYLFSPLRGRPPTNLPRRPPQISDIIIIMFCLDNAAYEIILSISTTIIS